MVNKMLDEIENKVREAIRVIDKYPLTYLKLRAEHQTG
jgi:hypothetical protein